MLAFILQFIPHFIIIEYIPYLSINNNKKICHLISNNQGIQLTIINYLISYYGKTKILNNNNSLIFNL